jgi:poly-gamma-glutamate synthesis protein (capsule biosynthesis protein)
VGLCAATWGLSNRRELASEVRQVESLAPLPGEPLDVEPIRAALDSMDRAGVDFKIVSVHWGFEYEIYPDARVMQVARMIVQAGADLVVGSHPHVVQPAEVLFVNGYERRNAGGSAEPAPPEGSLLTDRRGRPRKALVLYSLGNFTTAMSTFLCRVGAIQSLRLRRDPATGRVDWFAPRTKLSYKAPAEDAAGGRRLVLLSAHLSRQGADSLSRRDREDLQLLRCLVAGQ